eukprot:3941705-Rhodomonas_salina.3
MHRSSSGSEAMARPTVAVCVRMRRALKGDETGGVGGVQVSLDSEERAVHLDGGKGQRGRRLRCDEVLGPEASQTQTYKHCAGGVSCAVCLGTHDAISGADRAHDIEIRWLQA